MPDDYRPKTPLAYMLLDFDTAKGFEMLDDAQAGKLIKRLIDYAKDYAASFDDSLRVDSAGLNDLAAYIADIAQGQIKRRTDVYRKTSYARSENNGGRPKK